jgi:hypothetical protein
MLKGMSRSEGEAIMKSRGAITISIFALMLAIFSLISNGNSSKILSTTLSITDTWSFYQAKSIKLNIYELKTDPELKELARYESEKKEIMNEARKLETDRDEAKKRSPWYSMSITFLQIAMVLSSTSILAVSMGLLWASIGCSVFASILFANGYLLLI